MRKKLFILVLTLLMGSGLSSVSAARYTILYINTATATVGNRQLKVGDTFDEKDIKNIKWDSSTQCIKVRNESTKRTRVLTRRNVETAEHPTLKEYLVKQRVLATRDYTAQKTVQLLDTVAFELTAGLQIQPNERQSQPNRRVKYRAVWKDRKVWTSLPLSDSGDQLYLTRNIFGHHDPRPASITIFEYDLSTDHEPTCLGSLLVEPLPLVIEH